MKINRNWKYLPKDEQKKLYNSRHHNYIQNRKEFMKTNEYPGIKYQFIQTEDIWQTEEYDQKERDIIQKRIKYEMELKLEREWNEIKTIKTMMMENWKNLFEN